MGLSIVGKTDIWAILQEDIKFENQQKTPNSKSVSIWDLEFQHAKYADFCPLKIKETEVAVIETRNRGKTFMLHNPMTNKYLSIGEEENFLWQLMDGRHTVRELNMEYIDRFGKIGQKVIKGLLDVLIKEGFLSGKSAPIYEMIEKRLNQNKLSSEIKQSFSFFIHSSINVKKVDPYFSKIYEKFAFFFYKKSVMILNFIILLVDIFLFSYYLFVKHETMLLFSYAGSHDVIFFIVASYICVFIHENAHGLTVKHFGRKVSKGGFLILYGNPVPYVDTSDIWMKGRIPRIAVSFAGPFINGIMGGIFLIATVIVPESLPDNILTHLGLLNSLEFIANLIPIIETDGHYIIQDWFEEPNLRRNAIAFVKCGMWLKIIKREKWQKREFGYLIYGLVAVGGILYMIFAGIHLWLFTFRHIVNAAIKRPFMLVEILSFVICFMLIVFIIKFCLSYKKLRLEKVIQKHLAAV